MRVETESRQSLLPVVCCLPPIPSAAVAAGRLGAYIDCRMVIRAVARRFGLKVADLVGRSRSPDLFVPRHLGMAICRERLGRTLPAIGHAWGDHDRTTVGLAVKAHRRRRELSPELAAVESAISTALGIDDEVPLPRLVRGRPPSPASGRRGRAAPNEGRARDKN
jgi:hypothetical protein